MVGRQRDRSGQFNVVVRHHTEPLWSDVTL
jgi:hypothetical protein